MTKTDIKTYTVGKKLIKINRRKCTSCATCTLIAPGIFELDEYLISKVKEKANQKEQNLIEEAVDSCSSGAIMSEKI